MRIGTKSVLFGAHCFFLHPFFVARAWWKLYGFPWNPRLWFAFFVHDLGYVGKPNMDGPEGERHVEFGARLMGRLFGRKWHDFCLYHSRFYAKRDGQRFSRLCVADKLSITLTPAWLYLPMAKATGEILEYMKLAERRVREGEPLREFENIMRKYESMNISTAGARIWYASVQSYLSRWVEEHRDGRKDTWTPDTGQRQARDGSGCWQ